MGSEIGGMYQHIKRLSPFWRHPLLCARRGGEIAGRIRCRLALVVDRVELLFGVAREDEAVMSRWSYSFLSPR